VRLETDGSAEAIPLQRLTVRHRRWLNSESPAPAVPATTEM